MAALLSTGRLASILGLGMALVGFVYGAPLLYLLSGITLGLLALSLVLAWVSLLGIDCRRELRATATVSGDAVDGCLIVRERAPRWRLLIVHDQHRNATTGAVTHREMRVLTGGRGQPVIIHGAEHASRIEEGLRITRVRDAVRFPHRGRYLLGPLAIYADDPFGMWRVTRPIAGEAAVLVYPRPLEALAPARPRMATDDALALGDVTRVSRRTTGRDITGIRPYARGDDPRLVHWKASAHLGKLAVKEGDERAEGGVRVILDLQRDTHYGHDAHSTLEIGVTLAASCIHQALDAGVAAGLLATGAEIAWHPRVSGARLVQPVDETLAVAQADGRITIAEILTTDALRFTGRPSIVLITASADARMVAGLRGMHSRARHALIMMLDARACYEGGELYIGKRGRNHASRPPTAQAYQALRRAAMAADIPLIRIGPDTELAHVMAWMWETIRP